MIAYGSRRDLNESDDSIANTSSHWCGRKSQAARTGGRRLRRADARRAGRIACIAD